LKILLQGLTFNRRIQNFVYNEFLCVILWSAEMRKLLIVDGDTSLTSSYVEVFRRDGFDVLTAATAEEARQLMRRAMPDLVVMDVRTAEDEDLEFANEVTARFPDVPLIFHTAMDEETTDRELWMADAVVNKSSNFNELRRTVEEVLRSRDFESFGQLPPRELTSRRLHSSER
jgi:DNA-binding response OmpR family regulator